MRKSLARSLFLLSLSCLAAFGQTQCKQDFQQVDIAPGQGIFPPILHIFWNNVITIKMDGVKTQYRRLLPGHRVLMFVGGKQVKNFGPEDFAKVNSEVMALCPGFSLNSSARKSPASKPAPHDVWDPDFNAGAWNSDIVVDDFNGDGNLDRAVLVGTGIRVELFDSSGATLSFSTYTVTGAQSSLLAADLNKDGILDLVAVQANSSSGNLVVLLGKGDGTFKDPSLIPAGEFPFYIASGDFNGDGSVDLAVTSLSETPNKPGSVYVYLGKGDGTFAQPSTYTVGTTTGTIIAADFNHDGKLDLAALDTTTSNTGANKLWVLLGVGDGTFRTPMSMPSNTGTGFLHYIDLNHDGNLDLVIADQFASAMAIMMGNGDGTFKPAKEYALSAQPASVAMIPLGDGYTSVFTNENVSGGSFLSFAGPDGTIYSPPLQSLGNGPAALTFADLNGDGKPDLVAADPESGSIYVELGAGKGTFSGPITYALGSQPGPVAAADLNRDGKPDVIEGDSTGIGVLLGTGSSGGLAAVNNFPSGGPINGLAVADLNGDGIPDVAASNTTTGVSILIGNGDGSFEGVHNLALGGGQTAWAIVSGDFNHDGKSDLAVAYSTGFAKPGGIAIFLASGGGNFQPPVSIPLSAALVQQTFNGTPHGALSIGDFNKDGKPDLAVALNSLSPNQIAVLLGNGDGTFKTPLMAPTTNAPTMIGVADLDGDGNLDMLLTDCCGLAEASYLLGNSDGTFQNETHFVSGPNPRAIALADLNGDGRPDLAIAGQIMEPNKGTLIIELNEFSAASTTKVVSAADSNQSVLAPSSLATAYGKDLATGISGATTVPLPVKLGGTAVSIKDSAGTTSQAPLVYVSPGQVNFLVPDGMKSGQAQLTITSGDGTISPATVQVAPVAPGMFELNASGLAAAQVLLVSGGKRINEDVYSVANGQIVSKPVDIGSGSDQAYLLLYGTGLRAAGTSGTSVKINGSTVQVQYGGAQGAFPGLDQVNVLLPPKLAGAGLVTIQVEANGISANPVNITVK